MKKKVVISPNSIVLAKYFLLTPAAVDAYYCEQCKKIVIDLADKGPVE